MDPTMVSYRLLRFKNIYFGFKEFVVKDGEETAPESIDWRDRGAVTPVKNQGRCGSCWAFAIAGQDTINLSIQILCKFKIQSFTGALEAYYKNKTGELAELSAQYLLDCSYYDKSAENEADKCERGNHVENVLPFIKANGMVREDDYPYIARSDECDETITPTEFHAINEIMFIVNDERAMKEALHRYGPLIATVNLESYKRYRYGIFTKENCKGATNHAVLIVGYGSDMFGRQYWIVKNSHGEEWGERGYMRVTRDGNKNCGLSSIVHFFR